ncbi:DUF4153 domain-containing protein [Glycomyces algeriensis]|uniref:DUF4173 domain-containing protein n=1 Tax=Glycomyces algeriensis TaxID=256037 RepID=A0A9W6LIB8_9ACTN|nr:DUF4173 domain-containing protein [Glycomyces algeriensis]MDA1368680.1 DUF4173 domain-containing protein [Glycomyces algeriensis]MDR7351717.1 hypothetical protein [Glycomyces algeriensis]GLI44443.1 hypothetical protein GALLR39Z86_42930 [Glycomyces algeriensis]
MSDPADFPAPRPEDAETAQPGTPSETPKDAAPGEAARPETPMGDARPEPAAAPEPVPAQAAPEPQAEAAPTPPQDAEAKPAAAPAQAQEPPAEAAPQQDAEAEPAATPAQAAPEPPADAAPQQAAEAKPAAAPAPVQQAQSTRPPAQVPAPPAYPARQLSPAEYQQQAAYYQQHRQQSLALPPNPRWYRPDAVPKPAIVVLVIAVALFGGWAAFHSTGVGIGLSLTGIALLAVPLAAGERADLLPRLPGAVIVAALYAVAAIRDAGWVVFLCTAAAVVLTPLVLTPQRRFSGTAITVFMGWLEGFAEAFRWAKRGRRAKGDGGDGRNAASMRNLWVALITAALLIVFGGLFAAADSTFADLVLKLLPEISPAEFILRIFFAAFLFPLALLWSYTAVAKPNYDSTRPEGEHRTVSRFELSVPLGALNLLFVAFIAVQLRVFLGGEAYVMETAGLTFAEYARKGFWQLSFVAALALAVIAVAAWLAPKRSYADRWAARILLGTLCVLSMVVIASALYRMYTYAETYGLTRMRVWIFTVEIWLAILFALIIVCCWKLRATWLPRAVLASGALALLGMAAANPDALIARYNIEHDHQLDIDYLSGLSDDAIPELTALEGDDLDCAMERTGSANDDPDAEPDIMAWNLGRHRAADIVKQYEEADLCDWTEVYGLGGDELDDDRYGDPPSEDAQETTAAADAQETVAPEAADPPARSFFQVETCESLDHGRTGEWFGNELGEFGLEPGASDAFLVEEPVTAWLTCGYFSGGIKIEAQLRYTESPLAASGEVQEAIDSYADGEWLVQERSVGYALSTGDGAGRQFQYYRSSGNLVLYSYVSGVGNDAVSEAAAADLTGQMETLYATFA